MSSTHRFATIRGVTFDAGGTLLHPHPGVGATYRAIALRHHCDYDAAALDQCFRLAFASVTKDADWVDPEARERDFWRRVVAETIRRTGRPAPRTFEEFFAELWEHFARGSSWRLFPQAREILAALRARGFRLGVVSNWDRRLHTVLHECGLRPLLHAVVISSEAGAEKPAPAIFRVAEKALGLSAAECLHVGDSRRHDLGGARAAGWHTLLVRHDEDPDGEEEIGNLASVLERLPGRSSW